MNVIIVHIDVLKDKTEHQYLRNRLLPYRQISNSVRILILAIRPCNIDILKLILFRFFCNYHSAADRYLELPKVPLLMDLENGR